MEITKVDEKTFVTDSLSCQSNGVFPLFEDENIFFSRHLKIKRNSRVLDLGTGSGILAISASEKSKLVCATDINERALMFAEFNAYLNNAENKISLVKSDLFQKVNEQFDVVLMNLPFSITMPGCKRVFSANAGPDGMELTRRCYRKLSDHVKPNGIVQQISFSIGSKNGPVLFDLIKEYMNGRNVLVEYTKLYPPKDQRHFEYLQKMFPKKRLAEKLVSEYPYIFYVFMTIYFDRGNGINFVEKKTAVKFEQQAFSGSWEARLRRRVRMLR